MNGSKLRPIAAMWEWQESAACRDLQSSRFFSPHNERGEDKRQRENRAREICGSCPVRVECAQFALAIGEEHGIWGGTTGKERIALLRRPRGSAGSTAGSSSAKRTAEAA